MRAGASSQAADAVYEAAEAEATSSTARATEQTGRDAPVGSRVEVRISEGRNRQVRRLVQRSRLSMETLRRV